MKSSELRDLSNEELAAKERELTESLTLLRMRLRTNQLDNTARLQQTRRDVARAKTVRHERTLKAQG